MGTKEKKDEYGKGTLEASVDKLRHRLRDQIEKFEVFQRTSEGHSRAGAKQLHEIEQDVSMILEVMHRFVDQVMETDDPGPRVMIDHIWSCSKCGSRLGIFEPDFLSLRIRHKGSVTYVTPGVGGKVAQLCYKCGWINSVQDSRPDEEVDEEDQKEVAAG